MLFMDRPAESLDELFDRESEVKMLLESVSRRALTLVLGMRRVGKTSVVRAATRGRLRVYIDARIFEERAYISYDDLLGALRSELRRILPLHRRLGELLGRIRGVSVAGVDVRFEMGRRAPNISELLEAFDQWAGERGERLVLIIDEAQELIKLRGRAILPALGYAYDNLRNIAMVFTGSKAGLLLRFLRLEDPDSPLFGRYVERIDLGPFPPELSVRYLEEGFRQAGVEVGEDLIRKAVEALDGVVGWLAYFGLRALRSPRTALEETLEYATRLAASEFCHFVEYTGSRRYIYVASICRNGARWSEVKRHLQATEGRPITDYEVTKLLSNLVNYGFLEKRGDLYVVADPILRKALEGLRC
ncbi:ATPase [Thermoproteus uzoniensis 768-20]|uniref:ATPase n=1 Tax=Thermoproteus uzoniensis (strain 768-20) TaxID=999630 RepID=F2L694_THEU7|nr:ATP-binding protein [Thermoproteus uzoniensis]AEA12490.1 ATPase [Thermoproteus uzoniensis 768-20]